MTQIKKPPVLELVDTAKKTTTKKTGNTGGSGGAGSDKEQRFENYLIKDGAFYQVKQGHDGEYEIRLSDFTCKITEEIITDDGLADTSFLRIEGKRCDGRTLSAVDVPSKSFFSTQGSWPNEFWGCSVRVMTGTTIKDQLRSCIHLLSQQKGDIPNRKVYKFTGWKKINEQWQYLTGTGAITSEGFVDTVQVEMGTGHMNHYQLPTPLTGEPLKLAAAEALALLTVCPNRPYIGVSLLTAVARAPLGECHPTDFAIWLHGLTGSKKSAVAAIAQAFFGSFTARSFPGNWSDSVNDSEMKLHQAKDAIFVNDDFKPSISLTEANKLHAAAEWLIRNTGNQAGRGRRGSGVEAKAAPYNRSMMIVTAEDLPRGQSLLGRLLILELSRPDVDNTVLTRLQRAAQDGTFTGFMSAYLQWLAPRIDQLKKDFPRLVEQCRNTAMLEGLATSHPRAPEIYANLVAGFRIFVEFLRDAEVIDDTRVNGLMANAESALQQAFKEQAAYQTEQDETERFLNLLRAALSSGNTHISCRLNQGPPMTRPFAWGWREAGVDQMGDSILKPMGDCIGWYYETTGNAPEVWLQQDSAFKIVQQFARSQGDSFLLTPLSLWRRLYDKGLILKTERDPKSNTPRLHVKRIIAGRSVRVMVMAADLIESGE